MAHSHSYSIGPLLDDMIRVCTCACGHVVLEWVLLP
jgi:hypothetical protein